MKTWLKVTLGIFAFFLIMGIFGSIFNPSETNYQTGNIIDENKSIDENKPIQESIEPLTILNHDMTYGDYGNLMITGIAKNTGDKDLSYAQIDVKFYDKEGNVLSNSLDNINNLKQDETWKFEVMYFGLDTYNVEDYDISVGTVW